MKNHFLPQFMLKGFADEGGLFEFNIINGVYGRRSIGNAGQIPNFYSDEVETGILSRMDDRASRVFRYHLRRTGPRALVLKPTDRQELAHWIALFFFRTPRSYAQTEAITNDTLSDKVFLIESVTDFVELQYARLRVRPDQESKEEARMLDNPHTRRQIIAALVSRYEQNPALRTTPRDAFMRSIRPLAMEFFGKKLLRLRWRWLTSEGKFLVGDNPLCRVSRRTGHWDFGIGRPGLDVYIPLTKSLCLAMRRSQSECDTVRRCPRRLLRRINHLQLLSAQERVYGPSAVLSEAAARLMLRHANKEKALQRPSAAKGDVI